MAPFRPKMLKSGQKMPFLPDFRPILGLFEVPQWCHICPLLPSKLGLLPTFSGHFAICGTSNFSKAQIKVGKARFCQVKFGHEFSFVSLVCGTSQTRFGSILFCLLPSACVTGLPGSLSKKASATKRWTQNFCLSSATLKYPPSRLADCRSNFRSFLRRT